MARRHRRRLAPPQRAGLVDRRPRGSSGGSGLLARRSGLLRVAWPAPADRARMGICRPGRRRAALRLGQYCTRPVRPGPLPARRANYGADGCCAADDTDGFRTTAPVGSFPAGVSPYGLHDMAGNVWEWTTSRFSGQPGWYVIKGGGWGNNPYCLRAAYKHGNPSDIGLDMVGFRCAADESGRVRR